MSMFASVALRESGHQSLPKEMDPAGEGLDYGQSLPYAAEALDALARGLGVLPISTYFDDSEMLSDEERAEVGLPPAETKWCDPQAGLKSVRALVAKLEEEDPTKSLHPRAPVAAVLWDLKAARIILEGAVNRGEAFHISVG